MINELTSVQKRFLKAYTETSNLAESARRAGLKCNTIANYSMKGRAMLNSLKLTMPEILEMEGVSDQTIAQTVSNGLSATKTVLASFEGRFTDAREIDDHPTRHKFCDLASRLKGHMIERKEIAGIGGGDIILEVRPASPRSQVDRNKLVMSIDDE